MTDFPVVLPGQTLPAGTLQSFGEWFDWTPVLTTLGAGADPVLGSGGASAGDWHNNAGLVTVHFDITFGVSGVSAGSGIYALSVPVPLAPSWDPRIIVGRVAIWDNTGPVEQGRDIRFNSATEVVFSSEGGANVTNAVPWTWGPSDHMHGKFTYRGAAA